jgi:hypothetical protein
VKAWHWDVIGVTVAALATVCNVVAALLNIYRLLDWPVFYSLLATVQLGLAVWMWVSARRYWRRLTEHRQAARMNVRVVRDGAELPARLYHFGERDGQDVWVVVEPDLRPGDEVKLAVLPPRTTLVGMGEDWST